MDAPAPNLPALGLLGAAPQGSERTSRGASPLSRGEADAVASSLVDLVSTWTEESNGRAEAIGARGDALSAIKALGARPREIVELEPAAALAAMGWAAASGGAYGRRRGAAPGRFAAWLVLVALGDLSAKWPLAPDQLGEVLHQVHWYAWGAGEPSTGWALRLAVEGTAGPNKNRSWALSATDAV
jgi:hypothetical protein